MDLATILEDGRRDFLDAVANTSAKYVSTQPAPSCWSVLECIEHVIAVEQRYLNWISNGAAVVPRPDSRNEIRLFTLARSRLTRLQAPDAVRPWGRFPTLSEALAEFNVIRNRSVAFARQTSETLYSIGATHPRFGNLNGAEWIQLIDAHSRRHADQIRETIDALPSIEEVRMKRPISKKPIAFQRDRPDLPAELESAEESGPWQADSELTTIHEQYLHDVEAKNLKVDTFRIESSVLERVQFSSGQFGSAVWKDVRFIGCDFGNVRAHRLALVRVELIDCRLTGLSTAASDWQDVLVQNGDVRYAQIPGGIFRNCEFDECNWEEADLQNTDLKGSVFRSCKLARAEFYGAQLRDTDLRKSAVEGLLIGMNDLKGAIVDPTQAMIFAQLLGVQIR